MPKKPRSKGSDDVVEILQSLVKHIDERFDAGDLRFSAIDEKFDKVFTRLDRIEFLVSGQDRRLSILEDRMRMVATKLGLEFRERA